MKKTIFHIDANSAYLSWEAAYRLQKGEKLDLRTIPSAVGGDPKKRLGIYTIGDLANYDLELLKYKLKSHGVMI